MPYSYTIDEEVVERGLCQQAPSKEVGDMWFDNDHRLCVVDSVSFQRYVWEDVALWNIRITAYKEEEITADLRNRYDEFQQKQDLALQKSREEEEEKNRTWREDCKWRKIDIGVGGKFIVAVYENGANIHLERCEGESHDAPKVVVPEYVDIINDGAFADNENIKELVFLTEKCKVNGFSDWPNLEKIVLPGLTEFDRNHIVFNGCDKLESIELNGNPNNAMYYAVFHPKAIIVYKKAQYFKLADDIYAKGDVAISVSPRCGDSFEIPEMVDRISDNALDFLFSHCQTMIIPHNLTIYCIDYKNYNDAKVFEWYARGPKEKEIVLSKDAKITLAHATIIKNEKTTKLDFSIKYDYKLSTKSFKFIEGEDIVPAIQNGIRHFRGWGDEFGSEETINDIRGLFTTNVKILYQ